MDQVLPKPSRLVVAVDLLPLRPGGENGGLKPAIFTLLRAVGDEVGDDIVFVFLTNSASHGQVRDLARPRDILICVLDDPGYPCARLDDGHANEFKVIPPPVDLVRTIGADLLYCPFGATTFHIPGGRTVALIADLLHKDYPFTLTEEQIAERETYITKTIGDARLVQCISRSGVERMTVHYGVPAEKLFYTYLPIHARLDRPRSGTEATAKAVTERPFFFYPANLWLHKNHEVLLISYAGYRQKARAPWDLVLTFHEDRRADYLRSLAKALDISEGVHFLGFLSEADLQEIWLRAGALVFPSLHEGFGIPLLEAMHYGVPIITSEDFALKEVGGGACYVVDPRKPGLLAKALDEVSRDEELRARLIRLGRERLQLFEVKAAARTLWEAFCRAARTEGDLPRPPGYSRIPPVLSVPTPASGQRWKIEIHFEPQPSGRKCSVYLDNFPFAAFRPIGRAGKPFSFVCRPNGRTLAVRVNVDKGSNGSSDRTVVSITKIVARDGQGGRVLLYENGQQSTLP